MLQIVVRKSVGPVAGVDISKGGGNNGLSRGCGGEGVFYKTYSSTHRQNRRDDGRHEAPRHADDHPCAKDQQYSSAQMSTMRRGSASKARE